MSLLATIRGVTWTTDTERLSGMVEQERLIELFDVIIVHLLNSSLESMSFWTRNDNNTLRGADTLIIVLSISLSLEHLSQFFFYKYQDAALFRSFSVSSISGCIVYFDFLTEILYFRPRPSPPPPPPCSLYL